MLSPFVLDLHLHAGLISMLTSFFLTATAIEQMDISLQGLPPEIFTSHLGLISSYIQIYDYEQCFYWKQRSKQLAHILSFITFRVSNVIFRRAPGTRKNGSGELKDLTKNIYSRGAHYIYSVLHIIFLFAHNLHKCLYI